MMIYIIIIIIILLILIIIIQQDATQLVVSGSSAFSTTSTTLRSSSSSSSSLLIIIIITTVVEKRFVPQQQSPPLSASRSFIRNTIFRGISCATFCRTKFNMQVIRRLCNIATNRDLYTFPLRRRQHAKFKLIYLSVVELYPAVRSTVRQSLRRHRSLCTA